MAYIVKKPMIRTQIYLTEGEHDSLRVLARKSGSTLSELIRRAVDGMLEARDPDEQLGWLRQARGIWKDRTDLSDFAALRREGDARVPRRT